MVSVVSLRLSLIIVSPGAAAFGDFFVGFEGIIC